MKNRIINIKTGMLVLALGSQSLWAQAAEQQSSQGYGKNFYLNLFLIAVVAFLVPAISVLGKTLIYAIKAEQKKNNKLKGLAIIGFLFAGAQNLLAQADPAPSAKLIPNAELLPYLLIGAILIEAIIIIAMIFMINKLLSKDVKKEEVAAIKEKKESIFSNLWYQMNKFQPIENEAQIDAGHNYDGIRELNNVTPPWFIGGFILSILFAIIYLWVYHVSESAPLQLEEFAIEMAEGEAQKVAYLSSQANNIDESNITMLDQAGIDAGAQVYVSKKCNACHLDNLGGSVGPNLTDNFALHGGSLAEIFKSIKYGWVNKGMKAWKDELSPIQMAQLSSYIKSIQGTNVAGGKDAQGEPIAMDETPIQLTDSMLVEKI
jgi:cytochrome c oxidase cbb3-type subunit 3